MFQVGVSAEMFLNSGTFMVEVLQKRVVLTGRLIAYEVINFFSPCSVTTWIILLSS